METTSKKYELLTEDSIEFAGRTLYRIRALIDFGDVKAGDLGGYIASERNLQNGGDCWVYDEAKVLDLAEVYGDAKIYDRVVMYDSSEIFDKARAYDDSKIFDRAIVRGNSQLRDHAEVGGDEDVVDEVVDGDTFLCGDYDCY